MRISFERSGGFAGIIMSTTVDTANMTANEASQVKQLVEVADFFNLAAVITSPQAQYDRFQYRVTVEDNNKQNTVVVGESAIPGNLRPLIDWLTAAAKKGNS
ncbi:MAG: protealysin inhibitor emfourin [Nostocaceae cyanobacterium]|nr:protealysin inhibitor emfourin [Nostocaceae cyanobacterium]